MRGTIHHLGSRIAASPAAENTTVPILLVDNSASKRLSIKAILAPLGYRIVEADSGRAALRKLIAEDFAVILMDVRMPVMDGFETAEIIRKRQQSELTPIIFITAHEKAEVANQNAYSVGAADFITSPINSSELRAKVLVFGNLYLRTELLAARTAQLRETADRLTLVTDAAPIGIFRTDAANNYTYTNPNWTEITGISFEDAIGRPWDIVLSPVSGMDLRASDAEAAHSDALWLHRFEIIQPNGVEPRIVQAVSKPLLGRDKVRTGWVGTLSDVTAEVAAKAAMLAARDAAQAATLMQSKFAASASHELKTPTTSILGFIEEVLENDALSDDDRTCLEIAYHSAQRLRELIEDLLIVGQADIGPAMMSTEPTPLMPLAEWVVSSFAATAQHAGVVLRTELDGDVAAVGGPPCALADPVRLEQALTNLVSNAVKFTPRGGLVTVNVGRTVGPTDDTVHIVVRDTGMGMDAETVGSIFDRFFRAKKVVDIGIKGTGLGLGIAQQMIQAQNGQLTVSSATGQGSTFTITLPAAGQLHPVRPMVPSPAALGGGPPVRR